LPNFPGRFVLACDQANTSTACRQKKLSCKTKPFCCININVLAILTDENEAILSAPNK